MTLALHFLQNHHLKYSPIGELSEFASNYADTLSKTTGHIACITDKDTIIAVSGGLKKDLLEQGISKELEEVIENKEIYTSKENDELSIPISKHENKERVFHLYILSNFILYFFRQNIQDC